MTAQHKPTKERQGQVEAMAGYGIPEADIARVMKIDAKTLRKYYREELDLGMIKATTQVANTLFSIATDRKHPKCAPAAMFWLKCRGGWSEFAPPPAPRPVVEKQTVLGKKEQADRAAMNADEGTDWADDVETSTAH